MGKSVITKFTYKEAIECIKVSANTHAQKPNLVTFKMGRSIITKFTHKKSLNALIKYKHTCPGAQFSCT